MKPMNSDQLVTVMGGAAATNPSWIKPLPDLFGAAKPKSATKPTGTSWLR